MLVYSKTRSLHCDVILSH